ncbi:protein kinase domain protein [Ichthyophthirius multifiliis]|uniref:Calcium-dependent protein kinase 1 n=1 Tax=Ichthyophthirius multifiliis TaxID=5932 RepID=G0R4W4_ICHMU|nr:protein kinase domain protein [Ichthyophthirius multifiliis]EGR27507.1 protein kinase domain protein [Ichthyophthirius multifiliis]|eukprot:XP_004024417.1 protein kinase domain protein [Ichthyophthirius multifiliis]
MGCTTVKKNPNSQYKDNNQAEDNNNVVQKKENGKLSQGPEIFVSLKTTNIQQEYKFGSLLGEGAFGCVRLVEQKKSGIFFFKKKNQNKNKKQKGLLRAMKCIQKNNIIKEEEEKMFAEVNILKSLNHPNIIQLYELYQDEQLYYLITEYCSGGELFERIKQMDQFSEKEAADYMKQILSAILYCHQRGICHRDLKPENLVFDSKKTDSNLKVIDFGTSRKFDSSKKMTKRLGTPYYIAPEVLNQNYDEKCDIWSCGVILYILLCGYPPFNGSNEKEIFKSVQEGNFTFDDEDWGQISQEAKSLIKKMLEKDSTKRLSAQQAYDDVWITKTCSKQPLNSKVLQNLGQFQSKNKLRNAILTFIATYIVSQQEKEELLKAFKVLDQNGDGTLERKELIQGYMSICKNRAQAEEIVNKLFGAIDANQSGKVDFSEFIVAAMQEEKLLSKNKIEKAFKIFDQDGNGFIEKSELQMIMGGTDLDEQTWQEILKESDTNNDGKISQQEFIELLVKKIDLKGNMNI